MESNKKPHGIPHIANGRLKREHACFPSGTGSERCPSGSKAQNPTSRLHFRATSEVSSFSPNSTPKPAVTDVPSSWSSPLSCPPARAVNASASPFASLMLAFLAPRGCLNVMGHGSSR
jgi:hypothetical protein